MRQRRQTIKPSKVEEVKGFMRPKRTNKQSVVFNEKPIFKQMTGT